MIFLENIFRTHANLFDKWRVPEGSPSRYENCFLNKNYELDADEKLISDLLKQNFLKEMSRSRLGKYFPREYLEKELENLEIILSDENIDSKTPGGKLYGQTYDIVISGENGNPPTLKRRVWVTFKDDVTFEEMLSYINHEIAHKITNDFMCEGVASYIQRILDEEKGLSTSLLERYRIQCDEFEQVIKIAGEEATFAHIKEDKTPLKFPAFDSAQDVIDSIDLRRFGRIYFRHGYNTKMLETLKEIAADPFMPQDSPKRVEIQRYVANVLSASTVKEHGEYAYKFYDLCDKMPDGTVVPKQVFPMRAKLLKNLHELPEHMKEKSTFLDLINHMCNFEESCSAMEQSFHEWGEISTGLVPMDWNLIKCLLEHFSDEKDAPQSVVKQSSVPPSEPTYEGTIEERLRKLFWDMLPEIFPYETCKLAEKTRDEVAKFLEKARSFYDEHLESLSLSDAGESLDFVRAYMEISIKKLEKRLAEFPPKTPRFTSGGTSLANLVVERKTP